MTRKTTKIANNPAAKSRHELNLARQVLKRAATPRKRMTAEIFLKVMRANRRTK